MWRRYIYLLSLIMLIQLSISANLSFSQEKEDKEGKFLRSGKLLKKPDNFKFFSSAGIFFGYDSNVNLSPVRKGDLFQEFLYTFDFKKPLRNSFGFIFTYDLDVLNYNEITAASNILNHLKFIIDKKISSFVIGTGYNLDVFFYQHNKDEDGDFLFHKFPFYIKHNISRKLYQQLLFEYGIKAHLDRKALADTISTYQDKELVDKRQVIEYSIGSTLTPKVFLGFRTRFIMNDSNARYLDYYDYKAYEFSPNLNYKLSRDISLISRFSFTRRAYHSRLVSLATDKEKENIYSALFGIRYKLSKNNLVSIFYTYRDDVSKDPLEKYTENIFTCGWQYNF
ncbi:MAG: hypothetical protein PHT41_02905 [Candidatus Omnitrophica bacterium]|nr:hypothetical protein [Candidatus Omnitrophota bacterium]MDD5237852.1 hypothetical protein [Candidatus Omnitrophota bacterium]